MNRCRNFIDEQSASTTVEFVALMPIFLLLTFFIFEISIAVLFLGTVEKAAQVGVRYAIVSDFVVTTLPNGANFPRNVGQGTNPPGTACSPSTCVAFDSGVVTTCNGNAAVSGSNPCDTAKFNVIVNRMNAVSRLVTASNVRITYAYANLGYVGGPIVPRVTVTIGQPLTGSTAGYPAAIPYGAVVTNLLSRFFTLINRTSTASPLTNLPLIEATMTGEDITTAGAS